MNAIEIRSLNKTYAGGVEALKNVDLTVKKGEFFGLLGPNGAGKSTIIGVISSLVMKSSGRVTICGIDIDDDIVAAKRYLGVVPQEFNFNMFESCKQIVLQQAGYYGVPRGRAEKRTDELLKQLGLWEKRDVQARTLSGGMKRRLMIARALVHDPEILILDEPTAGVDISLRRSMWTFLQEANAQGLTIVLTTHYLEEAENLCERIAIIDKGRIIQDKNTHDLLQELKSETVILYCQDVNEAPSLNGFNVRLVEENTLEADIVEPHTLSELVIALNQHGVEVTRMRNKANRLEELFVRMVEEVNV